MPKRKYPKAKSPDPLAVTLTASEPEESRDLEDQLDATVGTVSRYHQFDQMRKSIAARDKLFKSKRADPVRPELYQALMKYLRNEPIEAAHVFFKDADEEYKLLFEQVCKTEECLENHKQLDKKKKIQDLTNLLMNQHESDLGFIRSVCAFMDLRHAITRKDVIEWKAYRLVEDEGTSNDLYKNGNRKDICNQAIEFLNEHLLQLSVTLNSKKFFYAHTKGIKGEVEFGFFCVREQDTTYPHKNFTTYFAFTPGQNNLFVYVPRNFQLDPTVFKIVVSSLGFTEGMDQKLRGKNLTRVYESCIRRVDVGIPHVQAVSRQFDEDMASMNMRHKYYLQPEEMRRQKLEDAFIDDGQVKGVNHVKIKHQFMSEGNEEFPPVVTGLTFDIKIKDGESMDQYVASLVRRGLIADSTPYMSMKASQTNVTTVTYKKRTRNENV